MLEDHTKSIKRVYDEVIGNLEDNDNLLHVTLPEFPRLRTRLQRVRSSTPPPIPRTVEDVDIPDDLARTWRGRDFLSHLDNDWGLAVCATRQDIRLLLRCSTIYIDGTFKTCPSPCRQFVTIHGKHLGRMFTLVMCLMTGKNVGQYRQLLQHIKRKVREVTCRRFRPRMVICDFEPALKIAIETELPATQLCGCYFHFCQSLWCKVQDLGLSQVYRRRRRLRRIIQKSMVTCPCHL